MFDFLMRYHHPDDFGDLYSAFTVCSFWWANALAGTLQTEAARTLFRRLLSVRNCVGLLSEDLTLARAHCEATSRRPTAWSA